jgi:short-subunit dehydrogenase
VTGASRGIGRAIAAAMAGDGYDVMGTSRDPGAIPPGERIPGVRYMSLDLTDEKSIASFLAEAGDVEVLVNNAGANLVGPVEEVPLGTIRALFEANLFGLIRLTQGIVSSMRKRRTGTVINIASFAGVSTVPFISMYAATKSALIALSRGLRQEVAPWGIRVAVVAPLHINTTFPLEIACAENSVYLSEVHTVKAVRDRNLAEGPGPELVAKKVLRLLSARTPRFFSAVGRGAGIITFAVKHLPDSVLERLTRKRAGLPALSKSARLRRDNARRR